MKWLVNATEGIVVAGGNGNGSRTDQLTIPGGIVVDEKQTIYVADENNHRVVSIPSHTLNGIIIAGGHGPGNASDQLYHLISLTLSSKGDLYVSDSNNFRIQMFEMNKNPSSGNNNYFICTLFTKLILISCYLLLMINVAN